MCCAINKQEKKIRDFDDADRKTEYMKKVMELMANAGEDDCAPSISIDLKKNVQRFLGAANGRLLFHQERIQSAHARSGTIS